MKLASLVYEYGGRTFEQRLVPPLMRVGRSAEMDIVISPTVAGVSRHHASLTCSEEHWFIEDAGSRNGTFINQQPATKSPLKDGDRIHLGPFKMTFKETEVAGSESGRGATQTAEFAGPIPNLDLGRRPQPWPGQLSCSINVAEVFPAEKPAAAHVLTQAAAAPALEAADALEPDQARAIRFFSDIGRALLVSDSLDEMLENVMIEIFRQVPAERGMIGLIDESNGRLVPKVVRSSAGDSPIQVSRTITAEAVASKAALLIEDTLSDQRYLLVASINALRIRSAMCVPLYCDGRVHGVIYADTQNNDAPFNRRHLEIFTALALFSAVGIQQAMLREKALREQRQRERLARYASPAVIDRVIADKDAEADQMLADMAEVSVLFADMKGFTSMSERKSPPEVVQLLNAVFTLFTQAVFEYQGTLDKFMGDGMLAFFGAPLQLPNHAECAVRAAVRMQQELRHFNESLPAEERIGLRIGINTGPAIVGDIGSVARKDYTVIGDTVNVASRFESSVAHVGEIVIGLATFNAVRHQFNCEALEPVVLKGKNKAVSAFRLVNEL